MTSIAWALALVLLALTLQQTANAFAPQPAPFWWLNSYLQNKSIGRFETSGTANFFGVGPCPTFSQKCVIDFASLPASIKNIGVNLPPPFPPTTITLGEAVPQGSLYLYRTELKDLELADLQISGTTISASRERVDILVDRLKLSLDSELDFANILIPVPNPIDDATIEVTIKVDKIAQNTGNNVSLSVFVDTPAGKTFANALPSNISLNTCNIGLDLGLTVTPRGIIPFPDGVSALLTFVIGIIQPLLGYVICTLIIEQTFTTVNGQPGIIRELLTNVTSAVNSYATLPDPNIVAEEQALVNALYTEQKQADKFSFRNSTFVQAASDVIDDWLGVGNPPYVNQVVDYLTGTTDGSVRFINGQAANISLELPLPPFYVGVDLVNVTVSGLNTFQANGFSLLANTSIGDYTFGNRLKLSRLSLLLNANIRLRDNFGGDADGGWIFNRNAGSPTSTSFLLTLNASLTNIDLQAWATLITDVSQLYDLHIGQLLGKTEPDATFLEQVVAAGKCASPFMYGLAIPFLTLSLGDVSVPLFGMVPQDVGITTLVRDVIDLTLFILESGIKINLPDVAQHFVRPLANEIAKQVFVSGGVLAECPEYNSAGVRIFPNFATSTIFDLASQVVNDFIGGNPVLNTPASINEIIRLVIETLIKTFDFPGTSPNPGQWRFDPDFRLYPGKSFVGDQALERSRVEIDYLKLYGIDTVNRLLLNTLPSDPNGFDLDFRMGSIGLELDTRWVADYTIVPNFPGRANYVDERFFLNVTLSGLALRAKPVLEYDLNELYMVRLGDALNLWCLIPPLVRGDIDLEITIANLQVRVTHDAQTGSVAGNALQSALALLESETHTNLANMVNYILKSLSNFARDFLQGDLPDFVEITRENCVAFANPFATITNRLIGELLTSNFTAIAENGLGAQPPPLSPAASDAQVIVPFFGSPWDLSDSFFVPLVNDFVTRLTQADLRKFLQTLGNSTANDLLSKMFTTDLVDGSVGLDANLTDILGAEGISLNGFIDNATLHLDSLKLSKLSNLDMTSIKVLKPVSKYVTETYLSIPGTMRFSFAFRVTFPRNFKNPADPFNQFLTESFSFELDLTDLIIDLQLLTAMDLKKLSALSIGNFITLDEDTLEFGINYNFFNCFLGLFFEKGLSLPKLMISLKASQPDLVIDPNNLVSPGTEATLREIIRFLLDFYVLDFADITQGFIRSTINDLILLPNVKEPGVCLQPTVPALNGSRRLFNFMENPTVGLINNLTTQVLAGEDGTYSLFNTIIGTALSASTFFPFNPSVETQTLGVSNLRLAYMAEYIGMVNASVTDIKLGGFGTFTDINLLQPRTNTSFFNELGLRGPTSVEFVVRYSINDMFRTPVKDDIRLRLGLTQASVAALVELQLAIPELLVIPIGGLTNITQLACLFTAVERLRLTETALSFGSVFSEVSCAGTCGSPLVRSLQAGGKFAANFTSFEEFALSFGDIVNFAVEAIGNEQFQQFLGNAFNSAENSCNAALNLAPVVNIISAPNPPNFMLSVVAALAIAGMVSGCVLLAPLSIPRHYHLKSQLIADHLRQANDEPNATAQSVARYMAKMEREALAMASHPAIPLHAKFIIVTVALVNVIFLFLSFLVFEAFTIDARVDVLGNISNNVSLVRLTIGGLIDKLWNSGSYILGVGLVILSGVWPILKNLLALFIFFAPKWALFPEKRRFILTILDVLGKYSFIEAFIVLILAVGLRFNILISEVPVLQALGIADQFLVINVLVTIEGGMVILCVAAMSTLALAQYMIWHHEKAAFADRRLFKQIDGVEDLMLTQKSEVKHNSSEYIFSTKFYSKDRHVLQHATMGAGASTDTSNYGGVRQFDGVNDRFKPIMKKLVTLATLGTMLALFIGQLVPFFSIHYDGVLGFVVGFAVEGGRVRTFTLMDLGIQVQKLSDGTAYVNFVLFVFQFLWYVVIIIAPHVQLALHLVVWLYPMRLAMAKKVYFAAKCAGYWASVEVFAIAAIAITFEIDRILAFLIDGIVGGSCTAAQPYLTDILGDSYNGVCVRANATIDWGFYIAWFAMMAQVCMGIVMIRANGVPLRDREDVLEQRPHQMWSWAEYFILSFMFEFGAEHHRPYLNPTSTMFDKLIFRALALVGDRTAKEMVKAIKAEEKESTRRFNPCKGLCSCFRGVESVGLDVPITSPVAKQGASKWNTTQSFQQQQQQQQQKQQQSKHHHQSTVTTGGGKWNNPPQYLASGASRGAAQQQQQQSSLVVSQPNNESANPIFKREKTFSIDV